MERYNYRKAIKEDVINYIKDNDVLDYDYSSMDELHDILTDELWPLDEVTGNGPDGYATQEKYEEFLAGNLRLLLEAVQDYGGNLYDISRKGDDELIKYADTTIRCYLLWDSIWDALKELGIKED